METIPSSLADLCLESYFIKITSRSKIIYWIIIGIIISGIGILPFVYVDVSVQAPGYFQSDLEKQIIYTPIHGKIIFTSIRSGSSVKKGDTLLIIDTEPVMAQRSAILQRISENNSSISDLEKLTETDNLENIGLPIDLNTEKYKADLANLRSQLTIQLQKYQKKKTEHDRNSLLFSQSIIPESDFENSLFVLNSEKDNLDQILFYQESLWFNDLTARRNESNKLLADLEKCSEELVNRIILAPISGEIIQSSDLQPGSIISSGQKIAEISPEGDLIATCFVGPSDIGFIYENQPVRIQVDAFKYNEWGMLPGEVVDISDDMILENGTKAYFRIKCKPDQTFLSLKNGRKANIKKGMSLNTRIVVIRRSLYNLLFDKADNWFNPYTYKPE